MYSSAAFLALLIIAHLSLGVFVGEANRVPTIGAVASLDARCSQIGTKVLRKGGNAADAMIATQFCVGVVGMYLTGIGGGGFFLARDTKGRYEFVDFRETAPASSNETMFDGNVNASETGGLASGVPGELRGLQYLHKNYGIKPWADLINPSIKLARDGFVVGEDQEFVMNSMDASLFSSPAWSPDFSPNGTRVKYGDIMTRKRYAKTLEIIRDKGADAFYTGPMADQIVSAVKNAGGILTSEDMRKYQVIRRPERKIIYGDYQIIAGGAPSGGIIGLNALNILKGYSDIGEPSAFNITLHRLDESFRFAFGARTKMGDPSFVPGMDEFQDTLLDETTAEETRALIWDNSTQPVEAYNPDGIESLDTPGTSHVSVADASGMAISLTSTINLLFGSQVMIPESGIIMNNEMNDFSIPNSTNAFGFIASPENYVKPGKRPLSSMSPFIVEVIANHKPYLVIGGAGGSRIITATVQGLWNVLSRGMNAVAAVQEPRIHDQLIPNQVLVEYSFSNATSEFLADKSHSVGWMGHTSDLQTVRILENGTFEAAGEPRQNDSGGFAV